MSFVFSLSAGEAIGLVLIVIALLGMLFLKLLGGD